MGIQVNMGWRGQNTPLQDAITETLARLSQPAVLSIPPSTAAVTIEKMRLHGQRALIPTSIRFLS